MARRIAAPARMVALTIDGARVEAGEGDTVAAALTLVGIDRWRVTPASGAPRGLYCGMGVCFDCLVTIDGIASRQACLTPVAEGMRVETGAGKRRLEPKR